MGSEFDPPISNAPSSIPAPGEIGPLGDNLTQSWELLKANPGPAVVSILLGMGFLTVVMFVVYVVFTIGMMAVVGVAAGLSAALGLSEDVAGVVMMVCSIVFMCVAYPVLFAVIMPGQLVMMRGGLQTARGEPLDVNSFAEGIVGRSVRATVMTVVMLLALMPATLLLYVPAIYLALRWSFALYLVVDSDLGAMDCLRASWRMTQGKVLTLFVHLFGFGIVSMLLMLVTCYLGMFVLVPLQMVFVAVLYMQVSGRHQAGMPDPIGAPA